MNQPQNPYAAPASGQPVNYTEPGAGPPPEVSVVAALKWSFSGVGFGNLAIGMLLLFIPMIGGVLLLGWIAETHRRLALRIGPAVPKFSFAEIGNFAMSGLPMLAAQMAVTFVLMFPLAIVGGVGAGIAAVAGSDSGLGLAIFLGVFVLLATVAGFVASVLAVAMVVRGELTGSIKETFNMSASWAFAKRNLWSLVGHHLVLMLLGVPLMLLGLLAVFVGMYFVAIAIQFAGMHVRWQIYERDVATGGERITVRTLPGADL